MINSNIPKVHHFSALSEPESQALHNHIKKIKKKILSAISVHSYGQDIYYPKVE